MCRSWTPLALSSFRKQFGDPKFVAEPTREDGLSQRHKEVATQRSFEEHNANLTAGGAVEYMAHRQAVVQGIRAGVLGTSLVAAVPCSSDTQGVLSSSLPVAHTLPVSSASSSSSSHGSLPQLGSLKHRRNVGQVGTGSQITLEVGLVQAGNCADVIAACETLCQGLGKSCWVKKNSTNRNDSTRRVHLKCFSAKKWNPVEGTSGPCPFFVSAVEGDKATPPSHVRITKCETGHTCSHGKDRQRAVPARVRKLQSDTLESFIPMSGRRGGNCKQLAEMVLQKDGCVRGYCIFFIALFLFSVVGEARLFCTRQGSLCSSLFACFFPTQPPGVYRLCICHAPLLVN